jgi:hypothetical protein
MVVPELRTENNGDLVLGLPDGLPISENGRPLFRPFQIVSLYEIVKPFHAGIYLSTINAMGEMHSTLNSAGKRVSQEQLGQLLKSCFSIFTKLKHQCEILELSAAFSSADKILKGADNQKLTAEQLSALLEEFSGRMADELKARECFFA